MNIRPTGGVAFSTAQYADGLVATFQALVKEGAEHLYAGMFGRYLAFVGRQHEDGMSGHDALCCVNELAVPAGGQVFEL